MGSIISAQEAYQELLKNQSIIIEQKSKELKKACDVFFDKSESIINLINKKICTAITDGKTELSLIVLPTCFTIEKFERILKYIYQKMGYLVETEIIHPQTQKIEHNADTCCIAMNLSWNNQKIEEKKLEEVQNKIQTLKNKGAVSDGYHTFDELYHHRAILFAMICNSNKTVAWKSKLHHTGDMYDGMFIVGIESPYGQITYHYDIDPYWDMFNVRELERAPEWDGSTPEDCINRMERWGMFI